MVGVRVSVGNMSIERAPSFLEVFGRTVQVNFYKNQLISSSSINFNKAIRRHIHIV